MHAARPVRVLGRRLPETKGVARHTDLAIKAALPKITGTKFQMKARLGLGLEFPNSTAGSIHAKPKPADDPQVTDQMWIDAAEKCITAAR